MHGNLSYGIQELVTKKMDLKTPRTRPSSDPSANRGAANALLDQSECMYVTSWQAMPGRFCAGGLERAPLERPVISAGRIRDDASRRGCGRVKARVNPDKPS
eukprot:1193615-Prorocentrum_minimum.AAC.2